MSFRNMYISPTSSHLLAKLLLLSFNVCGIYSDIPSLIPVTALCVSSLFKIWNPVFNVILAAHLYSATFQVLNNHLSILGSSGLTCIYLKWFLACGTRVKFWKAYFIYIGLVFFLKKKKMPKWIIWFILKSVFLLANA